MTDPLHVLRAPVTPADPDPAFAARLRARLERASGLPEGVEMSGTATAITGPRAARGQAGEPPADHGAAIPYLAVRDARRAIGWYTRVLGGRLRGEPVTGPGGRIGHAEIELGAGVIYLADEHPAIRFVAPDPAGTPVSLVLTVPDLDAAVTAATSEGASLDRGPYEGYGYRNATVSDPFGHRWLLQEPLPAAPRPGDVGYASLWLPDAEQGAAFYADVLGWEYAPGHDPRGRQVPHAAPPQGLWGGQARTTLFCSYVVADAAAAAARVQAAGGRAGEPVRQPYGLSVDCEDDQGLRFAVHEPPRPAGPGTARPAATRDGDLGYITLEVPDGARARDFYAAVLGWRIEPGRVADGWQVTGTAPLIGISGGHAEPAGVPLWRVSDVAAAAQRVRAAGGTAGDPQPQPYGVVAECADGQGTRFQLCQFPR